MYYIATFEGQTRPEFDKIQWVTGAVEFPPKLDLASMICDDDVVHLPFSINWASPLSGRTGVLVSNMIKSWFFALRSTGKRIKLVAHVGSASKIPYEEAVENLKFRLRKWYSFGSSNMQLLFENDAGSKGGTKMGSPEFIQDLRREFPALGFCFDTAHFFANAPEFIPEEYVKWANQADFIHLNQPDPNVQPGSHLDRHSVSLFDSDGRIPVAILCEIAVISGGRFCMEKSTDEVDKDLPKLISEAGLKV